MILSVFFDRLITIISNLKLPSDNHVSIIPDQVALEICRSYRVVVKKTL